MNLKTIIYVILLYMLFNTNAFASNVNESNVFSILNVSREKGWELMWANPRSILNKATVVKESLEVDFSQSIEYLYSLMLSMYCHNALDEYDRAKKNNNDAFELLKYHPNSYLKTELLMYNCYITLAAENYNPELISKQFLKAEEIALHGNSYSQLAKIYINLANFYFIDKNHDLCIEYVQKLENLSKHTELLKTTKAKASFLKGLINSHRKEYIEGKENLNTAIKFAINSKSNIHHFRISSIAVIKFLDMDDPNSAKKALESIRHMDSVNVGNDNLSLYYLAHGIYSIHLNENIKGERFIKHSLKGLNAQSMSVYKEWGLNKLLDLYESQNKLDAYQQTTVELTKLIKERFETQRNSYYTNLVNDEKNKELNYVNEEQAKSIKTIEFDLINRNVKLATQFNLLIADVIRLYHPFNKFMKYRLFID